VSLFDPSWAKLLIVLVLLGVIAVGGWFFLRAAVSSGVRGARRQEMLEWEAEQRGERR
jgi:hypothetical protein